MKHPVKIAFLMDDISTISPTKDSTLALMIEAQKRGWELYYFQLDDLVMKGDSPEALMFQVKVMPSPQSWYELGESSCRALTDMDVIMMRKDPPFNLDYITATYILERAQEMGVMVLNDPKSLRDENEKIFAMRFPLCCPPSLLSRSMNEIKAFLEEHKKIVLKPLDLMGGRSIFVLEHNDPNCGVIIEHMTQKGSHFVQAQKYIPEIQQVGDKRIILIDGEFFPYAITRIPKRGDHRGNISAGARVEGVQLTERDRWICNQIAPVLKAKNIHFAGIDIIGDYLTEINITSPTGIQEIDKIFGTNLAGELIDAIEQRLKHIKKA